MRLVAPISAAEDIPVLARAGADEFYCGLVPGEWQKRFGRSTANRRMSGNLQSFADLACTVATAHGLGKRVSVAFNAQSYSADRWDSVLALLDRVAASGADAAIIGDLGLLAALGERRPPLRLHLSSVASCRNVETAELAAELGATRVILPRHLMLSEIRTICRALPTLEIEAFILNDGCVFEEGACHTLHLPGPLGGPICLERFTHEYHRNDGRPCGQPELQRIHANDAAWAKWLWYVFSCGFSVTAEGLPHGPCGLCAIPQLAAAGVGSVKIAGREGSLERRLKSVEMTRAVLDRCASGSERETVALARSLRGRPELCASGFMCYYREVGPGCVRHP